MHRKRAQMIWGDLKKVGWVGSCRPKMKGDFRLLAEALWREPHVVWGRRKSHHRKIVPLSLCWKTFKLKGNKKKFVPELRSRKCVSGFLCSMYICVLWTLWTLCVPVWICTSHEFIYHIYPTPPLGQDMTQGQFFKVWIQSFPSPRLVASPRLKNPVYPTIYP